MECKSVWCPAPPNGVQQDTLCIRPVAVRPKKANLPSNLQRREPIRNAAHVVFFLMRISYISCRISVYIGVCLSSNTMSLHMRKSEYEYYSQLFQLANLKVVVQTYVSTIAKLAKHWEQLPVIASTSAPPVWPLQLSKGPLYCDQKWNHRSWTAKRQRCGVVLRGCSPQKSECLVPSKCRFARLGWLIWVHWIFATQNWNTMISTLVWNILFQ